MPIYSPKCIDESQGFTKDYEKGTLVPNKLGRYVMTTEEADEIMKERFWWWDL